MQEAIKIRDIEIGRRGDAGTYLDRQAFLALPSTERVVAYLALVWPSARKAQTVLRVCHVRHNTLASLTASLRRIGTITRSRRGLSRLQRERTS